MRLGFSKQTQKQYRKFPMTLQSLIDKQLSQLLENIHHPSLDVKKFVCKTPGVFQARVNKRYRFYFQIKKEMYYIVAITDHR